MRKLTEDEKKRLFELIDRQTSCPSWYGLPDLGNDCCDNCSDCVRRSVNYLRIAETEEE